MYQTSKEYKDSMNRPVRNRSYIKIQLGMINQDAQRTASLDDADKYSSYSDPDSIFGQHNVKRYATYEESFWKANGELYFMPRTYGDYKKNGIISSELFSDKFRIKFTFGCGKQSIKGLTIKFGINFPKRFSVRTDSGVENDYENDSELFTCEDVFQNTESLELIITEMNVKNTRVRIDYILLGLGLEYDNEWISSTASTTSISAINEDLPESEFDATLYNKEHVFNVDNPSSDINFLESGQQLNVVYGYELDDGRIEWMQLHSLYVSEWSADDELATIKAVDILKYLDDKYYKGMYYQDGIPLYELAVLVFEDCGISEDGYFIDDCLKKVIVYNPLPNVTHKEALQIIANAGRCILDYDRNGKIRLRATFTPNCDTSSNGDTYYSDTPSIDYPYNKNHFATYEHNFWKADGGMVFVPVNRRQDTGYVSSMISEENGKFSKNPILTRTLEAKYKAYGIMFHFSGSLPKKFIIRTYADGELNDTITIDSGIEEEFNFQYEFNEYDKMEVEFIETEPNSRIHVDYMSLGSETSYSVGYDDLYSTPTGSQLEKIKTVKVARYLYTKSNSKEDLLSEKLNYAGGNQTYYLNDPCCDYSVNVAEAKSGQSAKIVASGSYYVEVAFDGVEDGEEVNVTVSGYKYNVSTAYCTKEVCNKGVQKEWANPLLSDESHCNQVARWLADYFSSCVEYELDYRGEPALDCGDVISQESMYESKLKTIVEETQINFDTGVLSGGLRTRRKDYVAEA